MPGRAEGYVSAVEVAMASSSQVVSHASFSPVGEVLPCTEQQLGDCRVTTCGPWVERTQPDAGEITITGAATGLSSMLVPNEVGIYGSSGHRGMLAGMDAISFHASGGQVPAFEAILSVPAALVLTAPNGPSKLPDGTYAIGRESDVVLAWDGGVDGVVLQLQAGDWSQSVLCVVDSTRGTLTLGAELLQQLPDRTVFLPLGLKRSMVTAGDHDVTLYVGMEAKDSTGASVGVTLLGTGGSSGTGGTGGTGN